MPLTTLRRVHRNVDVLLSAERRDRIRLAASLGSGDVTLILAAIPPTRQHNREYHADRDKESDRLLRSITHRSPP